MTAPKPGRASVKVRVAGVESLACGSRESGCHELVNDGLLVVCRWCRVTWTALDAAVRGAS